MKRFLFIIIAIMLMFSTVVDATPPPGDINNLFPDTDTLEIDSTQPKIFDKYPTTYYVFDSEKFGIFDSWAYIFKAITNALFMLLVFLSKGVNYLLMACYKLNIFNLISGFFDSIVWSIRDAVFLPLMKPILSIVGLLIIFNAGIGRFMYNWRLITNTIMIFVIAFSFFAAPSLFIDQLNNFSQDISGEVLAKTASITTGKRVTADDAVVNLGNSFWTMTVIKPWQLIQFGDIQTGESQMDKFLNEDPDSDKRKALADKMAKKNNLFRPTGTITRFVMVLFIGLIVLVLNVFVGIMAALITALQFAAIISAIVGILAFAIALLPNMGVSVALHSLYNTFGFLLGKIGMAVLLAMYFAISTVIYALSNKYGWMMVTLLQVILILTIILFRKKIFGFLQSATAGQQAAINNIYRRRDPMKSVMGTALKVYGAKKIYDEFRYMRDQRKDNRLSKKYKPMAEEYLMQRYTKEKRVAEAEAKRTKKDAQYSDYVKRVDARVDKGYTPFDEREIESTVEMMKGLKSQGNDPKNLLTTKIEGESNEKIKLKQHDLEKRTEEEKGNIHFRRMENKDKINKNIKSDKGSKLYSRKTAAISAIDNYQQEAAATISEYPELAILGSGGYDDIVITSRNRSAIGEIERDKRDRQFREMKKQENIQANEDRQLARRVVNGNDGGSRFRPIGRAVKRNTNGRVKEAVKEDNNATPGITMESSNDKYYPLKPLEYKPVELPFKSVENIKENSKINTSNKVNEKNTMVNANERITNKEKITTNEVTNKIDKNLELRNKVRNIENNRETNEINTNNVANEKNTMINANERITNKEKIAINEVTNKTDKNVELRNKVRDIENSKETNEINTNNVANEKRTTAESNERVRNTEKINKNKIENITNKAEEVRKENKNIENVKQTNETVKNNIVNEQKNITEDIENIQNKDMTSIEEITNSKNINKDIEKKTINNRINKETIIIRAGNSEKQDRIRGIEAKLDKINKIMNKKDKE